jgi:histidinol-phosphate aminotransferase
MAAFEHVIVRPVALAGRRPTIDLSLNESSRGASPRALAAATARLATLHRYPDPASRLLREAIGRAWDLPHEDIVCGNGSEELLDVIGRLLARPGDEVLFTEHGFLQFPMVTARVGATPVRAPERAMTADIDALLARVTPRTRVLFLANPNNPTGSWVDAAALRRLRDGLPPQVALVIDSAYAEYVDDPAYSAGHELVAGRPNVFVARTFSKAFGLAALRVGWVQCPAGLAPALNRMRGVGNVNALAQAAAAAALEDLDFVAAARAEAAGERRRVAAALAGLGFDSVPGGGNFLCAALPPDAADAAGAVAHLGAADILVRPLDDYGLPRHLRITLGRPAENDALLAALAALPRGPAA